MTEHLQISQADLLAVNLTYISNERIRRIKTRIPWVARNSVSTVALSFYFKHMTMRIPKEWLEND